MTTWYIGLVVWVGLDGQPGYAQAIGAYTDVAECYKHVAEQMVTTGNKAKIEALIKTGLVPLIDCVKAPTKPVGA